MEAKSVIEKLGGEVVGFASLANRGFCKTRNLLYIAGWSVT